MQEIDQKVRVAIGLLSDDDAPVGTPAFGDGSEEEL